MIDRTRLRRLLLIAVVLFLISAGAAFAIRQSLALIGGLFLGFLLGAAPFASWAWILSRGLWSRRLVLLTVVLLAAKLGVYGVLLYLFVTREIVNPVGVVVGITEVVAVMTIGMLLPGPTKAGEAA